MSTAEHPEAQQGAEPQAPPQEVWAFDTETLLIEGQRVIPPLVSLAVAEDRENVGLNAVADPDDALNALIDTIFGDDQNDASLVGHNAAYDLAVTAGHRPDLFPRIFDLLENSRVHDTKIREKLLNLATTGDLSFLELPDGSNQKIGYSLADLERQYLGVDRSEQKTAEDAWRVNYQELAHLPSDQWPAEATEYALDDAVYTKAIYECQEERRQQILAERGVDPFATEAFHVGVDFCLLLMTAWGFRVDRAELAKIEQMVERELSSDKLELLVKENILRPGKPPEPYANDARQHLEGCEKKKQNGKWLCDCPPKMKKGKKPSVNTKAWHAYVEKLAIRHGLELKYTEKGNLSIDAEWLDDHWHLDPVLEQYRNRQKLQKLVTTELPRMKWKPEGSDERTEPAQVVHPCYDVLKETGRTSSFATDTYPSFNVQNVDPRVRKCYVPRDGHLLFGIDYSQMELGTLAQKCLDLFGRSVLAETINAGVDVHAYTGAHLAYYLNTEFQEACEEEGATEPAAFFESFYSLKGSEEQELAEFYKHYRKFAKPTNLGYPGGLGPATFCKYAKATFGVVVDEETAYRLREVWKTTYPEMPQYFEWLTSSCEDLHNSTPDHQKFAYVTPFGMYRAGCDYCAAANGIGLQSPSAEGAKLAVFNVVRACYDWTMHSDLYGDVRPIGFVHDELIGEVKDDGSAHERVEEMRRIMVESMRVVTPDVQARTEAVLMRRWDKAAEPVHDTEGRLIPWDPPPE